MGKVTFRFDPEALPLGVGQVIASPVNYYLERMATRDELGSAAAVSLGDPHLAALIYGAPGTGKNAALRALVEQAGPDRALYVTASALAPGGPDNQRVMADITERLRTALLTGEPTILAIGEYPGSGGHEKVLDLSEPAGAQGATELGDLDSADGGTDLDGGTSHSAERAVGEPADPLAPEDPDGAASGSAVTHSAETRLNARDGAANHWQAIARKRARERRSLGFERPEAMHAGVGAAGAVELILATVRANSVPAVVLLGSDVAPQHTGLDLLPEGSTEPIFHGVVYSGLPDRAALTALWSAALEAVRTDDTIDTAELAYLSEGLTRHDIAAVIERAFAKMWSATGIPIGELKLGQLDLLAALGALNPSWKRWFDRSYGRGWGEPAEAGLIEGIMPKRKRPPIPPGDAADMERFERGTSRRKNGLVAAMRTNALAMRAGAEAAGGESDWDSLLNREG